MKPAAPIGSTDKKAPGTTGTDQHTLPPYERRPAGPGDPRHGTIAGYSTYCRCDRCVRAKSRYDKRRKWELNKGVRRRHPIWRARRRIEALQAIGWSLPRIAAAANMSFPELWRIANDADRNHIYEQSLRDLDAAYQRLHMRPPPANTKGDRVSVHRARNKAARLGYAPPLAWDDIDDPNEQPQGSDIRRATA